MPSCPVCSPRRVSGPSYRATGAAVSQTFDRGHAASLSSVGDVLSASSQPPPRFTRRVEPTVIERQGLTMPPATAQAMTRQPVAVVPAAVVQPQPPPPPPPTQMPLAEQTNPTPTRYTYRRNNNHTRNHTRSGLCGL